MWAWIQEFRRNRNFGKALAEAAKAKYVAGIISKEDYQKAIRASKSSKVMRKARQELRADGGMYGFTFDELDFEELLNWFLDEIVPILKTIIPILLLFMESGEA